MKAAALPETVGGHTASQALQWVLPKADVERWLKSARPGERLIYAHGPQLIRGETSVYVRDLAIAGMVDLFQKRAADGAFDYTIQKGAATPAPRPAPAKGEGGSDAAQVAIYLALVRDARKGRRGRTNAELAELAGLETPAQAAWRVQKLCKAQLIQCATITSGRHAGWRIVTIVRSGRRTAAPPKSVGWL